MTEPHAPILILASASPRRRELLTQLGLSCQCLSVQLDESPRAGEAPADQVARLALAKALAARERLQQDQTPKQPPAHQLILAADTLVTVDNAPLGKPADAADAARMLARLAGRWHQVITSVTLLGRRRQSQTVTTQVLFRLIEAAEARAYWNTGEPRDKAGGYGIQGLGALFVERIEGSYSNVVGLPLFETGRLLAHEGLSPLSATLLERRP